MEGQLTKEEFFELAQNGSDVDALRRAVEKNPSLAKERFKPHRVTALCVAAEAGKKLGNRRRL